jgi:hypothetical protein
LSRIQALRSLSSSARARACIFLRSEVAACNRADGVAGRHRLRGRGRFGSAATCS